ncbi:MAG: MBL fold metallo-hydrolase, partial [Kangiellaceae bacterium]
MSKTLFSVMGNSQKLDGGAMFGNAPKGMWQKWVKVDEQNRIDLACRCLLVKEENSDGTTRNILFEVGIGAFFEPKLKDRFGVVESEHVLLNSLADLGLSHQDIDIVVLSHLHFDHIGGMLTQWQENKSSELLFPNATIIVGKRAWERAFNPHFRDRASFIPELMEMLKQRDNVVVLEQASHAILGDDYRFHFSDGHTP